MPLHVKTQWFILPQAFTGPSIKDQSLNMQRNTVSQMLHRYYQTWIPQRNPNSKHLSTREANKACSLKIKVLMILASLQLCTNTFPQTIKKEDTPGEFHTDLRTHPCQQKRISQARTAWQANFANKDKVQYKQKTAKYTSAPTLKTHEISYTPN